jgi:hypothetical protein
MGGGAGGGASVYGGGGRVNARGEPMEYPEGWMIKTKKEIEAELKFRGIDPAIINEITSKIEEPSAATPVIIAILATALILTLIFAVLWPKCHKRFDGSRPMSAACDSEQQR